MTAEAHDRMFGKAGELDLLIFQRLAATCCLRSRKLHHLVRKI
jgi:hypothetical protein